MPFGEWDVVEVQLDIGVALEMPPIAFSFDPLQINLRSRSVNDEAYEMVDRWIQVFDKDVHLDRSSRNILQRI